MADPKTDETVEEKTETEARAAAQLPIGDLLKAGVGWAALTADAASELINEIAARAGVEREHAEEAAKDTLASWKKEVDQLGERPRRARDRSLHALGIVRPDDLDELALRVAQLEHRVKLLERQPGAAASE